MGAMIRVKGLGKRYRLGEVRAPYVTLRETLMNATLRPFQAQRPTTVSRDGSDTFWALKDVTLDIDSGETIGIIGRNGAGKSTLLKVLSRVTEPTTGRVELYGRVGSLLEVGTGFHPELSGLDNIFLSGTLLGMRREQIAAKLDEIVAFAELERFIDTPVKRYSSGMYMRLGFAVAAHLDSEILFVDEVLAVGDASFQKKCFGRMETAASHGRTVCLVSHDMTAVTHLCRRSILLDQGRLVYSGATPDVIGRYLGSSSTAGSSATVDLSNHQGRQRGSRAVLRALTIYNGEQPATTFRPGDCLIAELLLESSDPIRDPKVAVTIQDSLGRRITTLGSWFRSPGLKDIASRCRVRCTMGPLNFGSGRYAISVGVGDRSFERVGAIDTVDEAVWIEVVWNDHFGSGVPYHSYFGPVLRASHWEQYDVSGHDGV